MASAARRAPLLRAPGFPRTPPSHGRGRSSRRGQPSLAVSQGRGLHRKEDAYEVPLRDLLGVLEELQVLTPPVVARLEPAAVDRGRGPVLHGDARGAEAALVHEADGGQRRLASDEELDELLLLQPQDVLLGGLVLRAGAGRGEAAAQQPAAHEGVGARRDLPVGGGRELRSAHRPALLEVLRRDPGARVEPAAVPPVDDPALDQRQAGGEVVGLAPEVEPPAHEVHAELALAGLLVGPELLWPKGRLLRLNLAGDEGAGLGADTPRGGVGEGEGLQLWGEDAWLRHGRRGGGRWRVHEFEGVGDD
mmetsp:Transcript_15410/g.47476  ORF Transcript_15410/g.47476 Transcript_15410/m.47476 type:complete len:306 (-) Transcript_15410:2481-3398(-)